MWNLESLHCPCEGIFSYAVMLWSWQPSHIIPHMLVFNTTFHSRYQSSITASRPVGVHLFQFLQQLTAHYSLQALSNLILGNCPLDLWLPTQQTSEGHHTLPHVPLVFHYFHPTWTTQQCILTGDFFMDRQAVLSYLTLRYFLVVCIILIAFSLPKSMLCTVVLRLSGANLSHIISFAQIP